MKRLGVLACLVGALVATPLRYIMRGFINRNDIFTGEFPVYLYPLPIPKEEQSLQALAKSIYTRLLSMGALRETPEVVESWLVLYESVRGHGGSTTQTPVFKHGDTLFGILSIHPIRLSVLTTPFVFICVSKLLGEEISLTVDTAYVSDPVGISENFKGKGVYSEPLPDVGGVWQAIPDECAIDGFEPNLPITLFDQDGFNFGVLNIYPGASAFRTPGFSRLYNKKLSGGTYQVQRTYSGWAFDKPLEDDHIIRPPVVRSDNDWGFEFTELAVMTATQKVYVLQSEPMIARMSPFLKGVTIPRAAFEKLSAVLEGYSPFRFKRQGDQLRCVTIGGLLSEYMGLRIVFPGTNVLIEIDISLLVEEVPGDEHPWVLHVSPSDTNADNEVILDRCLWDSYEIEFSSEGIALSPTRSHKVGPKVFLSFPEKREEEEPETADSGWIVAAISGAVSFLIAGGMLMWLRNRELDPRLSN